MREEKRTASNIRFDQITWDKFWWKTKMRAGWAMVAIKRLRFTLGFPIAIKYEVMNRLREKKSMLMAKIGRYAAASR